MKMTTMNECKKQFNIFLNLTKRHLLVFFKNKMRVFYTLLVPIIILVIYAFFLKDLEMMSIKDSLDKAFSNYPDLIDDPNVYYYINVIIDSWMLSGIISLSTLTVSLQTNNIFVEDKENGVNRDFISSPIKKSTVISSYFVSNFIVTFSICLLVMLISFLYLVFNNEFLLNFDDFCLILLALIVAVMLSCLSMILICLFIKKESTLSSVIALVATAAGFLIGAYIPTSILPSWAANICAFIPGTYSTGILRNVFSETVFSEFNKYLSSFVNNNEISEMISYIKDTVGYNISFFDLTINVNYQSIIVIIFIVIFGFLNILFSNKIINIENGREIKRETIKFKNKIKRK